MRVILIRMLCYVLYYTRIRQKPMFVMPNVKQGTDELKLYRGTDIAN